MVIIISYLQDYVIIILCFSVVGQGISSVGPLYEEVDSMILNPRYLAHKLHTTGDHTHIPSSSVRSPGSAGVPNPLKDVCGGCSASEVAGVYSYAECGGPPAAKTMQTLHALL